MLSYWFWDRCPGKAEVPAQVWWDQAPGCYFSDAVIDNDSRLRSDRWYMDSCLYISSMGFAISLTMASIRLLRA